MRTTSSLLAYWSKSVGCEGRSGAVGGPMMAASECSATATDFRYDWKRKLDEPRGDSDETLPRRI
jgi:hypothetical protein